MFRLHVSHLQALYKFPTVCFLPTLGTRSVYSICNMCYLKFHISYNYKVFLQVVKRPRLGQKTSLKQAGSIHWPNRKIFKKEGGREWNGLV